MKLMERHPGGWSATGPYSKAEAEKGKKEDQEEMALCKKLSLLWIAVDIIRPPKP